MRFITYQTKDFVERLLQDGVARSIGSWMDTSKGYIECYKPHYDSLIRLMNRKGFVAPTESKYPIWGWIDCDGGIVKNDDESPRGGTIRLTFEIPENAALTYFSENWHFLVLSNDYESDEEFEDKLLTVTKEDLEFLQEEGCLDLEGVLWELNLKDLVSIEFKY